MAPKPKVAPSPKPSGSFAKSAPKSKAGAAAKSPLQAAAKGMLGGEKVPSQASTAKVPESAIAAPAVSVPADVPAVALYDGQPLDVKSAEALLLGGLTPSQMKSLAETTVIEEQLPARMMLELVGDKDMSWANASKSLQDGPNFKKEILEMEGAKFITRKSIERFEALGRLEPTALQSGHPTAFAMAVYLEAVIWAAKENLGMNVAAPTMVPGPDETAPEWPILVDMKGIPAALADALKWKRTPLFVCSGKAHVVDTYFSYQSCTLVDAKWIMNKVDVKKEMDVPQMQEQLRIRLVSALKFGQPIHIPMSNSAVMLRAKYCKDDAFPEALFNMDLWFQKNVYSKVIRDEDLADWPGAFPGRMKDGGASYAFVTSDFDIESAREFLPGVLPHFDNMAIIQVDPSTIDD